MFTKENREIIWVAVIVLLTAAFRIFNAEAHIYNMVPVAAIGLFSGSILAQKRWSYIIPLAAMFISDIGISMVTSMPAFYGVSQIMNYAALALVTLMGTQLVKRNAISVLGYTLSGSMVFFLLSNLGTFLGGYYGYSTQGFTQCYLMAIPFYKNEFATQLFLNSFFGDLLFSTVAFGFMYMISRSRAIVQTA